MSDDTQLVAIDQIYIGMFIRLDLSWFEHSFPINSFKIANQAQINQLKALKLKHIRFIPSKSAPPPDAAEEIDAPLQAAAVDEYVQQSIAIAAAKRARFEQLKKQREDIARCEENFVHAATTVRNINQNIFSRPQETIAEAAKLVDSMASIFLDNNDTVMNLIQKNMGSEDTYFHSLNVSVLAMMLAHEHKCSPGQIKIIGMAGLFHDLGKVDVPERILTKNSPLSPTEQAQFELHTKHGVDVGRKANLDKVVLEVIAHHHEFLDGTGYPQKLKGDAIPLVTRIVTIANVYDNLCNNTDPLQSLSPHEALSRMYAHRRAQFDPGALATLIKSLGVYPPGTLVRLSNEAIGLVMCVNVGKPLRPKILIYDSDVPKDNAIILDLGVEDADLGITGSIRPGQLPRAIFEYLNPRKHVNYYFDSQTKTTDGPVKNTAL